MAWTPDQDGSGSRDSALMNPLLDASSSTSRYSSDGADNVRSANANANANNGGPAFAPQSTPIPPPPVSGNVPSPTNGIHRMSRDGFANLARPASTEGRHNRHHQLRHRTHFGTPPPPSNRKQQQAAVHHHHHSIIHNSQSLDDADAAGGTAGHRPQQPSRTRAVVIGDGLSKSEPAKIRSFSHPASPTTTTTMMVKGHYYANSSRGESPSTHSGGSRSLGPRTPEHLRFNGTEGAHYYSSFPRSDNTHEMRRNNDPRNNTVQRRSYQQHSTDFFNQPLKGLDDDDNNNLPPPPPGHKMERGLKGAYGGSEHDFLLLSASSSFKDNGDDASSSSSHSIGHAQSYSPSKRNKKEFPPMPPLEITTTNSSEVGVNRINSYPPYGLETIEGSPAIIHNGDRKRAQMSLSSRTNDNGALARRLAPPLPPDAEARTGYRILGFDLSSYDRRSQFLISATATFFFSLLYGYLQELISVRLCHRKLGLFLAFVQFMGYTILSFFFRKLDGTRKDEVAASSSSSNLLSSMSSGGIVNGMSFSRRLRRLKSWGRLRGKLSDQQQQQQQSTSSSSNNNSTAKTVPFELYVGLSILRAIDLGMTNLAMQYVNYPAKTLMKSTRVVFTMLFGIIVTKKRYGAADFGIVGLMVAGLGMFMHADAKSSAVFQPLGIVMLVISLLCDGAISNLSEALMNRYDVGQDEFIFRLYSIATFFICIAAAAKGDLHDGIAYLTRPGTLQEMEEGLDPTWSVGGKVLTMLVFSTTGFLGSSCSSAITKSFGALNQAITSTARKAATIFLSFALFPNECTVEHVGGIFLFITSLVAKSLRASRRSSGGGGSGRHHHHHHNKHSPQKTVIGHTPSIIEMGGGGSMEETTLRRKVLGDAAV